MQCSVCGTPVDNGDRYCRACGRRFPATPPASRAFAPPREPSEKELTRRSRFALRLKILSGVVIAFALVTAILAQAAPDLIRMAGFGPVDLGVSWTEQDYRNVLQKCAVTCDDPPQGPDRSKYEVQYSGSQDIDWSFTDSEITALLNGGEHPGYWPASRIQVKVHGDNVLEVSCAVDAKKLLTYPIVKQNLPQEALDYAAGVSFEVPVHAEAQVRFTGPKQASATVRSLSVMGISMAGMGMDEQANRMLESMLNAMLQEAEPVNVSSFTTSEGSMHLTGKWYRQMRRIPVK